ncbi:MAG: hypothetical protein Kow00122_14550 [Thermoleophilia bacterium]
MPTVHRPQYNVPSVFPFGAAHKTGLDRAQAGRRKQARASRRAQAGRHKQAGTIGGRNRWDANGGRKRWAQTAGERATGSAPRIEGRSAPRPPSRLTLCGHHRPAAAYPDAMR